MTSLPTRPLGRSGLEITVVGCGTWAIGGARMKYNWGPQDDSSSSPFTAPRNRTGGELDRYCCCVRARARRGDRWPSHQGPTGQRAPVHFHQMRPKDILGADPFGEPLRQLRPDSVRQECDASLRRLGVEQIDLLQFHWPDNSVPAEDSWGTMVGLIEQGKVRCGGVSNYNVTLLERCEKIYHVGSLQLPFSLIDRRSGASLVSWCASNGTGVICYSPMQCGLLTDSFSAERVALMDPVDFRLWHQEFSHFTPPALQRNLALRDSLRPIAKRHDTTVAAVAVTWVLGWAGVTGAIVGSRSPDQVDGWIGAGAFSLTDDDLDEIEGELIQLGIGFGPTRPPKAD